MRVSTTHRCAGGSLTLLLNVEEAAPASASAGPSGGPVYTDADFADKPPAQRRRVSALISRGVTIDDRALRAIGIPPPKVRTDDGAGAATSPLASRFAEHVDQLKSLADGHVQLVAERFAAGRRPALVAAASIGVSPHEPA